MDDQLSITYALDFSGTKNLHNDCATVLLVGISQRMNLSQVSLCSDEVLPGDMDRRSRRLLIAISIATHIGDVVMEPHRIVWVNHVFLLFIIVPQAWGTQYGAYSKSTIDKLKDKLPSTSFTGSVHTGTTLQQTFAVLLHFEHR